MGALQNVNDEVSSKYYGCGFVYPHCLQGLSVLDLGCGAGRDCFVLSQLVGPNGTLTLTSSRPLILIIINTGTSGRVVGVDMTREQISVAERNIDWHMKKNGYDSANVEFKLGYIERLNELGFEDASFDIIVSNCVVNLSPDKEKVLREVYRLLKAGGG